jgi:glycosyltransferase involved in cell wall biosynthesis
LKKKYPADPPLISVVVPLYNEENNVRLLVERLKDVFERLECDWEIVFALDPSPDGTKDRIGELIDQNWPVRLVTFSRRIGKPLSLLAGLEHSLGDAAVIIDADLQDPPELIETMVKKWQEGFNVVIAQRISRKGESFLYLKSARLFYRLLEKISEVPVPRDTGDYRLLDARVVREICRFRERHGFLRGISAATGFSTAVIPFDRDPRHSGKTQISFAGAVNIALDGIIPFSRTPVRAVFCLGCGILGFTVLAALALLILGLFWRCPVTWTAIVVLLWTSFMAGLTITCLGVIGEYVVRTYEESRDRPLYIVDELLEADSLTRRVRMPDPPNSGRC